MVGGAASFEVWFYHLDASTLEAALPPLLEKCLERGWRALVVGAAVERLAALDELLWVWRDDAFLPHGLEGPEAARQPVLLTTVLENRNQAQAVFLTDASVIAGMNAAALQGVERVVVLFDGADEDALRHARAAWKQVKADGRAASYWRQDAAGRFVRQGA
jgi:DNA polymerase-3 subunit chi